MKRILRALFKRPPQAPRTGNSKAEEPKGPYARFYSSGIEVDLDSYFATEEGKKAWERVAKGRAGD